MSEAPLWAKRWVHFILKDFFFLSGQREGCLLWTRRAQPAFVLHSDQKVSSSQTEEKHRLSGRNCCQHWPAEVAFEIYSPPPKTSTIPLLVKCGENTSDWKMKNLSTYVQIVPWNSYVLSLCCVFQQPSALCSRFLPPSKKGWLLQRRKNKKNEGIFFLKFTARFTNTEAANVFSACCFETVAAEMRLKRRGGTKNKLDSSNVN